jgi:hypothetical protein
MKSAMELLGEAAGRIFSPATVPTGTRIFFQIREDGKECSGMVTVLRPWDKPLREGKPS